MLQARTLRKNQGQSNCLKRKSRFQTLQITHVKLMNTFHEIINCLTTPGYKGLLVSLKKVIWNILQK